MKKILSAIAVFFVYAIQTSIISRVDLFGIEINLMLTFALVYAAYSDLLAAGIMGCICGLLLDVSSSTVFGYNGLIVMYIAVLTSIVASKFYSESRLVSIIIVAVSCFLCELVRLALYNTMFESMSVAYASFRYILPQALLNSVVSVPVTVFVKWLKNEYIRGI